MAKPKEDDPAQSKRFIEIAQEHGGDEKNLAGVLKKIVQRVPVQDHPIPAADRKHIAKYLKGKRSTPKG
jgi:hypothetical protein